MDEPTYHEEESQEVRMCYFLLNILRNRAQMTDELWSQSKSNRSQV